MEMYSIKTPWKDTFLYKINLHKLCKLISKYNLLYLSFSFKRCFPAILTQFETDIIRGFYEELFRELFFAHEHILDWI
jgi:hypothetical protein